MFLLRAAFWLSVVILFLPGDPESGTEAPRVSAFQALVAAKATITDMSGFCDRNPDVCVTGSAALSLFTERAENGARMIFRYFDGAATDKPAAGPERGTLNEEDLAPAWRDPGAKRAA
jgi:hypothetical protein